MKSNVVETFRKQSRRNPRLFYCDVICDAYRNRIVSNSVMEIRLTQAASNPPGGYPTPTSATEPRRRITGFESSTTPLISTYRSIASTSNPTALEQSSCGMTGISVIG